MKKLIIVLSLFVAVAVKAQAPQYLNYQGVARNSSGTVINSGNIGVRFEILQGSATGALVYQEETSTSPSAAGIFTTAIGSGTNTTGTFSTINWGGGPYFIRVSIDPVGGTSFSAVGTSQLLSVPYALYAEKAGNAQTLVAGNGITINSGTISTVSQTVNINQSGIANVLGAYPNYTVDVPIPNLSYNNGTQVLTLTQGPIVSTASLSSGSGSVSITGAGIATVTPVGPGTNFTVDVATPTLTGAGSTTVSGTYPNFLISTPPGSTVTAPATNIVINPPHTTTTLSPGNYSINVQPTNITGTGVTGSYPNYTIIPGSSTSVTSGGSNVVVSGSAPSYTISASTPTIQINSPNSVTPLGLNNYSITVPSTSLTGVGVASVSGTPPNYTVTVPGPSLTVNGNSITISQGTVSVTKTLTTSPWNYGGGNISPANNPTNDKVAIGQVTSGGAMLDVSNTAASTLTVSPVVYMSNANASLSTSGVLQVKNSAGNAAGIYVDQNANTGDGVAVNLNGTSNGSNALQVQQFGVGNAGYFSISNTGNGAKVIDAVTNGNGIVLSAVINNTLNTSSAIFGSSNGSGSAGYFNKTGTGYSLYSNHGGTSGTAGSFNISNAANTAQALNAQTSGSGDAIAAYNTGTGRALYATNTSSFETALIGNSGAGRALQITNNGNNETVYMSNLGSGPVLYATSNASLDVAQFNSSGNARSVVATNTSAFETIFALNSGTGKAFQANNTSATNPTGFFSNAGNNYAMLAQNSSAVASRAANIVGGLDIMGKTTGATTFPLIITNIGSTNLFNVRDDGHVGIGVTNPGYRLAVLEGTGSSAAIFASNSSATSSSLAHGIQVSTANTNSLAAGIFADNSGSGPAIYGFKTTASGIAGRFEIGAAGNSADVIFASTSGTGASLHTKNNFAAGANNLGVLIEDGHIGSISAAIPTIGGTACTACNTQSVQVQSNDIAGTFGYNMSGSYGANYSYTITFNKPYRKRPIVNVTPASSVGSFGNFYVTIVGGAGNYTGFTVTWPSGVSGGAGSALYNYMVIESSN